MAQDIGSFKEIVKQRSQFYESIDIRTVAVKQDFTWYNLHTDAHLRPKSIDELSISEAEIQGPTAYFREVVSFDKIWDLFDEMFGEKYSGYDEPVVFPGLSVEGGDDHWKENIYRAEYWDYDRADEAYGILIQSNTEEPLNDRSDFQDSLRQLDPPFYNVNDLCREHLGHTSYRWTSPQARFFAPLFIRVTEHEITESGNLELKIQAHDSIQDLQISTWAKKDQEFIDREKHTAPETEPIDSHFHKFQINWEIKGNPSMSTPASFTLL